MLVYSLRKRDSNDQGKPMKKFSMMTLLLGSVLSVSAVLADQSVDAAIGGAVGGGLGAYLGSEIGGREGAIIGGAIGGGAGAAIATDRKPDRPKRMPRYHSYPEYPRHFCPPGQAKKGRC